MNDCFVYCVKFVDMPTPKKPMTAAQIKAMQLKKSYDDNMKTSSKIQKDIKAISAQKIDRFMGKKDEHLKNLQSLSDSYTKKAQQDSVKAVKLNPNAFKKKK